MLVAENAELAREGHGLIERFLLQPPGEKHPDWAAQAKRQLERFRTYLSTQSIYVDVWDGDSLLQIGTAQVPLAALLRAGTEQVGNASTVKEYLTADVFATTLTSIDAAPPTDAAEPPPPLRRGVLKLVLARFSVCAERPGSAPPKSLSRSADGALGWGERAASDRNKVRLRALPSGSGNVERAHEPTAAEAEAVYQRELRRQKRREWLRSHDFALAASTPCAKSE